MPASRIPASSSRVAYQVQPSADLPEGYREGFVAGVGDSRNIDEGEALHVGHAVVQAAVEAAQRATNGPFQVVFEADAKTPEDVRALAGRRGRLVVTRRRIASSNTRGDAIGNGYFDTRLEVWFEVLYAYAPPTPSRSSS